MSRRNSRSDIAIFFGGLCHFSLVCVDHAGAQRQRCALELARSLGTFFFELFSRNKKNLGNIIKCWLRNSQTLRRHFPTLRRNFPKLRFMDLQSPWRKGVLHCLGSWDHLFVSQAYGWWAIVSKPSSQTHFFGSVIFWMSCIKNSGLRQTKTPFRIPALVLYATI